MRCDRDSVTFVHFTTILPNNFEMKNRYSFIHLNTIPKDFLTQTFNKTILCLKDCPPFIVTPGYWYRDQLTKVTSQYKDVSMKGRTSFSLFNKQNQEKSDPRVVHVAMDVEDKQDGKCVHLVSSVNDLAGTGTGAGAGRGRSEGTLGHSWGRRPWC